MEIQYWPVNPVLKKEAEENYRTRFALSLQNKNALSIMWELTFDGAAPKMTVDKIEALFDYVERHFLKKPIAGVGVEVGAGPLTFSSILAKRPAIQKMYGIEICQPVIEKLFPKVARYILGEQSDKVIGVVGSFDEIQLPDDSIDFIFDFFSLHHSLDINVTLKECHRILKPGGFIFCFDKARPNHYSQSDLDELLDTQYGPDYHRHFDIDWQRAFLGAGFSKFQDAYLAKTLSNSLVTRTIKNTISFLPPRLQQPIQAVLPKPKFNHKFILADHNRVFVPFINHFPKEISLMVAYK